MVLSIPDISFVYNYLVLRESFEDWTEKSAAGGQTETEFKILKKSIFQEDSFSSLLFDFIKI